MIPSGAKKSSVISAALARVTSSRLATAPTRSCLFTRVSLGRAGDEYRRADERAARWLALAPRRSRFASSPSPHAEKSDELRLAPRLDRGDQRRHVRGKSEELIRRVRRAIIARRRVQVFKSHLDSRYAGLYSVSSHDGTELDASPVDSAAEIFRLVRPDTAARRDRRGAVPRSRTS